MTALLRACTLHIHNILVIPCENIRKSPIQKIPKYERAAFNLLYENFENAFLSFSLPFSFWYCLLKKVFLLDHAFKYLFPFCKLRAQSFTSLMADLRQDINRVPSFSRCLNGTFPWRNCSVKTLVLLTQMRRVANTNLPFWVNLPKP